MNIYDNQNVVIEFRLGTDCGIRTGTFTTRLHMHSPNLRQRSPILDHIVEALSGLEFGAVEITVHHGRIVQIERREKVRLDQQQKNEPTGVPEASNSTAHNRDAS